MFESPFNLPILLVLCSTDCFPVFHCLLSDVALVGIFGHHVYNPLPQLWVLFNSCLVIDAYLFDFPPSRVKGRSWKEIAAGPQEVFLARSAAILDFRKLYKDPQRLQALLGLLPSASRGHLDPVLVCDRRVDSFCGPAGFRLSSSQRQRFGFWRNKKTTIRSDSL